MRVLDHLACTTTLRLAGIPMPPTTINESGGRYMPYQPGIDIVRLAAAPRSLSDLILPEWMWWSVTAAPWFSGSPPSGGGRGIRGDQRV